MGLEIILKSHTNSLWEGNHCEAIPFPVPEVTLNRGQAEIAQKMAPI